MTIDEEPDDLIESIKILSTDDERLKSFGQLFANDSARKILQLLFNEELTAAQISQKTDVSLQLVKYHLHKLQDLGVVKISKTSKNSKSHDMKYYVAKRFSVVVVPPKFSKKTKGSRLLVHSFRHIYRVAGLGVATGIAGMFSVLQLMQGSRLAPDFTSDVSSPARDTEEWRIAEDGDHAMPVMQQQQQQQDTQQQDTSQSESLQPDMSLEESTSQQDVSQKIQDESMVDAGDALQEQQALTTEISEKDSETAADSLVADMQPVDPANVSHAPESAEPEPEPGSAEPPHSLEGQEVLFDADLEGAETLSDVVLTASLSPSSPFPELFLPLVAITAVLGGLTIFYLAKYLKKS